MNSAILYALVGVGLFSLGLYALILHPHLLRKILAINVMGSGLFLVLIALAKRTGESLPDVVPQAMVITGIVVAFSATALALTLMVRVAKENRRAELSDNESPPP